MGSSPLRGALTRAILGGVVGGGVGATVDPEDPLTGAETGALAGAGAGAGTYLGTRTAQKVLPYAAKFFFGNPTGRNAIRKGALDELTHVLQNDEVSTDDIRRALNAYPHMPMTVTDAAGENALARADVASKVGGPQRNSALDLFRERMRLQPQRMRDLLRQYLTPNLNSRSTTQLLVSDRQRDAKALYDQALFDPDPTTGALTVPRMVSDPTLPALLDRLDKSDAFKLATEIAHAEGTPPPIVGQPLTAQQLDLIKRGLDASINAAYKSGNNALGRARKDLKHEFVGLLDTKLPGYEDARKNFSDYSTSLEAVQTGREFDQRKWSQDDLLDYYHSLDPGDQDFFRLGMGHRLNDIVSSEGGVGQDVTKYFNKRDRNSKMSMLFPSPNDYVNFSNELEQEQKLARTGSTILGGSPTQRRLAEERERADTETELLMDVARHPGGLQSGLVTTALKMIGHDPAEIHRLTSAELTRIMLNPRLHENMDTLRQLDRRQRADRVSGMVSNFANWSLPMAGAGAAADFAAAPYPEEQMPTDMHDQPQPPEPQHFAGGGLVHQMLSDPRSYTDYDHPPDPPEDPHQSDLDELYSWANKLPEILQSEEKFPVIGNEYYNNPKTRHTTQVSPIDYFLPGGDVVSAAGNTLRDWMSDDMKDMNVGNISLGQRYNIRLGEQRHARDLYAQRHPTKATVAGLMSWIPALASGGEGLIPQMLAAASNGALYGFVTGEDGFYGRLENALETAPFAALFPPAGRLAKKGWHGLQDAVGSMNDLFSPSPSGIR